MTARAASAHGQILVRGDSAYGTRSVVTACVRHDAQFSLAMTRNTAVERTIAAIDENAWTPVKHPGAVRDPDAGVWISNAEVAEIHYTAFAFNPERITARLIVRRVKDARYRDDSFPCGDITRSSPAPTCPSPRPTSLTASTRSSRRCSPISSTDLWPTYRLGGSAPTPPGSCVQPWRTTCCAPQASSRAQSMP